MPAALFPEELPTGAAYQELIARVRSNEIIRGKLLSDDGQLALVVLSLDPKVVESKGLEPGDRRDPQDRRRGSRRLRRARRSSPACR